LIQGHKLLLDIVVDRKFHTPENQQSWANIIELNRVATAVNIKVWSSIEDNFTLNHYSPKWLA